MKAYWEAFVAWFNGRVLRERVLMFLAAVAVAVYGGYQLLLGPAWRELQSQRTELDNVRTQIRAAEQERRGLSPGALDERAEKLRGERQSLRQELDGRREELAAGAGQFIEPQRLMGFLERFLRLRTGDGMQVRSLESLEREVVPGTGEGSGPTLYRKGVRAELEAGYGATHRFLERLAELPWAVQVSRLDYQVLDHPTARITLEAHTFLLPEDVGAGGGS